MSTSFHNQVSDLQNQIDSLRARNAALEQQLEDMEAAHLDKASGLEDIIAQLENQLCETKKSLPITCPQHYKGTRREHRSFQNPAADYLVRFLKVPSTTRFFTKVGSAQPFLLCETTALNFTVSDWIQLIHSYPATVFHLLNVFDSSTAVLLQSQRFLLERLRERQQCNHLSSSDVIARKPMTAPTYAMFLQAVHGGRSSEEEEEIETETERVDRYVSWCGEPRCLVTVTVFLNRFGTFLQTQEKEKEELRMSEKEKEELRMSEKEELRMYEKEKEELRMSEKEELRMSEKEELRM
ncbi:vimentin [Pimephales promelas]|nr:vimentin [Pimephales promelas]